MIKFKIINTITGSIVQTGSCDPGAIQFLNIGNNEELIIDDNINIDYGNGDLVSQPTNITETYYSSRARRYPNKEDQLGAIWKFIEYMIQNGANPPDEIKNMLDRINKIKSDFPKP